MADRTVAGEVVAAGSGGQVGAQQRVGLVCDGCGHTRHLPVDRRPAPGNQGRPLLSDYSSAAIGVKTRESPDPEGSGLSLLRS
ncbi:hypothetical protein GCM10010433_43730 [Streptomyces pulveraceus]